MTPADGRSILSAGMGMPAKLRGGDFREPDYTLPLEVSERQANCPADGVVKGMFFTSIVERAAARGGTIGRPRYVAFRGYPLSEWIELLPVAAELAFPHLTPREGMRRFGQEAFDVFTASTAGRVLFSMAGRNVSMAVELTPRVFDVVSSHGSVKLLEAEPGRAVFALRDMWDYIDAWHVGIFEGGVRAFGLDGRVRVRTHDMSNADLELRYPT